MTITTLRNASLQDLAGTLKSQADSRYDVVVHSDNLRSQGGNIVVADGTVEHELTAEGVTSITSEVTLKPTQMFESGLAQRLAIPGAYLGKCRETGELDLFDHNVNTWLSRSNKSWFVRAFKGEDGADGIARAFLSDRFGCIDNFDVLLSALQGVRDAGVTAHVVGADLSERKMSVRVVVPEIAELAPVLLENYRSPFGQGYRGDVTSDRARAEKLAEFGLAPNGQPIIFAGFVIENSETGGSAFTITPRLTVLACFNGMQFTDDRLRKVHLGSQMDQGLIKWSDATNIKQMELVKSQATDAVQTFCNVDYIKAKIAQAEEKAGVAVTHPTEVIKNVCDTLKFTQDEADGILGHFIAGGQVTAGGVMQAVTSFSQTVLDPDRANEIEALGMQAMLVAAS